MVDSRSQTLVEGAVSSEWLNEMKTIEMKAVKRKLQLAPFISKFIQTIERRDLISLCQSWIVEHRVAEIFDRRSH